MVRSFSNRSGELRLAMTSEHPGPTPSRRKTTPFFFFCNLMIPVGSADWPPPGWSLAQALTAGCSSKLVCMVVIVTSLSIGSTRKDETVKFLQQKNYFGDFMLREIPLASPTEQVYGHEQAEACDDVP